MLAGMSVTWYTWLEQGRNVRASRQVLGSLADVLGLNDVETAHLFHLAEEVPPRGGEPETAEVAEHEQAMLDQLDPNPALLLDRRLDVVAWNRGAMVLYGDLRHLDAGRRNILWLTFTSDEVRAMSDDWETDAAQTVAFFRAHVGDGVGEPAIAHLIAELEAASADFARMWRRKDLAARPADRRVLSHPVLGRVEFVLTKLRTLDDRHTVVAYLPSEGSEVSGRLAELVDDMARQRQP